MCCNPDTRGQKLILCFFSVVPACALELMCCYAAYSEGMLPVVACLLLAVFVHMFSWGPMVWEEARKILRSYRYISPWRMNTLLGHASEFIDREREIVYVDKYLTFMEYTYGPDSKNIYNKILDALLEVEYSGYTRDNFMPLDCYL